MKKLAFIPLIAVATLMANNIEVLVDTSGSMKGREKEVIEVIKNIKNKKSDIGITLFNNVTKRVNSNNITNFIMSGGTNLSGALIEVEKYNPKGIIVITDGRPNDANKTKQIMQELRQKNIVICSTYIGKGTIPTILRDNSDVAFTIKNINDSINKCFTSPELQQVIKPVVKVETKKLPAFEIN